jgi:signal transduction histidine kinase/CheY-like chemotaxis protein
MMISNRFGFMGRFADPAVEAAFNAEYRHAGLKFAAYAALSGAFSYLTFIVVAMVSEEYGPLALLARALLACFLLLVAWSLLKTERFALENYAVLVGSASSVALGGAIVVRVLTEQVSGYPAEQTAPAIAYGLFLHYAFLRLPLSTSSAIGWSIGLLAVIVAPALVGGAGVLRNLVYLLVVNLAGMVICRSIETRERALFAQRIQLEEARSAARERAAAAEEANREKTRLIAAISHDLRQPMTAAMAYMDVLNSKLEAVDVEGAKEQVSRVESAVNVLGATLDHLVTAARYDSGREAMDIASIDVGAMLLELRDSFAASASQSGVDLRLRLPHGSVIGQTDARSLHRVLTNLVSNAIKFSRPNGARTSRVLLALRVRAGHCRIDIVDKGIGIAPADLDEVWKPFVQLHADERDRAQGLGLGLFLVRRIIEQLPDHSIRMRSTLGQGTCATVTLPGLRVAREVATAAPVTEATPLLQAERAMLKGAFVVLIEDDQDTRRSLTALLESWGVLVASGATLNLLLAGESLDDRSVDAIVCDYRLPSQDNGLETIVRLKSLLGYSPCAVLITGESDAARIAERAPADVTVLHKPFTPRALALPLIEAVSRARLAETFVDGDDNDDRAQPVQPGT